MNLHRFRASAGLALLLVFAFAEDARAQRTETETETEAANATAAPDPDKLFNEAMLLLGEGKFAEAIPKLEEAQHLDPGIGTQFNLAICYAKTGRLALAWKNFRQVATLAGAAGKKERAEAARDKLLELRPHFADVSVRVDEPYSVTVSVDGEIVPPADLEFIPLDPGQHKVEVTAPGLKPFEVKVFILAIAGERHEIVVPTLTPVETTTTTTTPETPILPEEAPTNTRRTLGYVFGTLGVAGLATATLTGLLILSDKSTADERCRPDCITTSGRVDSAGADAVQRGRTLLPINVVAWVVAGVGLGAGTFFLVTSPTSTPRAARTTVVPSFDARGGQAVLTTTF